MRTIILKSPTEQMTLPVTPERYQISHGQTVEIVNIHQLGDIALPGRPTLCKIDFADLLLPAGPRSYSLPQVQQPEWYLWHWRMWVDQGTILRFIVSDTYINLPVLVEQFSDEERDGTGDRYCSLTLREFRYTERAQNQVQGGARAAESPPEPPRQYTVVRGDCLSAICRRFYGDGTAAVYQPLAAYNGIRNPDLIYPGQVLQLPDRDAL